MQYLGFCHTVIIPPRGFGPPCLWWHRVAPPFSPTPRPAVGIPRIVTCMGAEVAIGQ